MPVFEENSHEGCKFYYIKEHVNFGMLFFSLSNPNEAVSTIPARWGNAAL
jgi:hypothetical protein